MPIRPAYFEASLGSASVGKVTIKLPPSRGPIEHRPPTKKAVHATSATYHDRSRRKSKQEQISTTLTTLAKFSRPFRIQKAMTTQTATLLYQPTMSTTVLLLSPRTRLQLAPSRRQYSTIDYRMAAGLQQKKPS